MMKLKNAPIMLSEKKSVFKKFWLFLTLAVTFLVIWVQGKPLFENGLLNGDGALVFKDAVIFRDSLVHLSLINEIASRFPPTNFAAGGIPLKNYHYLFDTILTIFSKILPINTLDLYFRLTPIILSTALCLVIFLTIYRLTNNKLFSGLGVFFTIFATSFGALVPSIKILLHARTVTGGNNMFMTDQIFNMLINPQGVLALIIFLTLFLLLEKYSREKKTLLLVFYGLLLGVSFGIKAYGGIVFAAAGTCFSLYYFAVKRDLRPLAATGCGILLITGWFFYTIDTKVAGIKFAPFWLLDVMYTDLDRLNEPNVTFMKSIYANIDSWHHVIRITVEQFLVYFVGSLGLRLLGFVGVVSLVKNLLKVSPAWVFLLIGALISLVIPLFFNQSSKAYDIVQFTPYFSLFMGIMFTYTLFLLAKKLPHPAVSFVLIAIFILSFLALDQRDLLERTQSGRDEIVFSKAQLGAIDFIKNQTPQDSIFLLPISDFNDDYLWLPGLAGRRTFYSGSRFASQVGVDIEKKKNQVKDFQTGKGCTLDFDYIYSDRTNLGEFDRIRSECKDKVVFENNEAVIYHHN